MKSIRSCHWKEHVGLRTRHVARRINIVYRRLPGDLRMFPGIVREATPSHLVVESPIMVTRRRRIFGKVIADSGYLAIWFIYRHRCYDIGKFYDKDRKFIGYYCDIIQPVRKLHRDRSKTTVITDLFLDLWITPKQRYFILDEDELETALKGGYISPALADHARRQMRLLTRRVRTGRFPPLSVQKATLLTRR